jgi:hypothetical protein
MDRMTIAPAARMMLPRRMFRKLRFPMITDNLGYCSSPVPSHLEDLHQGVRYEERGPAVSAKSQRVRLARMVRELKRAGYQVITPVPPTAETV